MIGPTDSVFRPGKALQGPIGDGCAPTLFDEELASGYDGHAN